MNRTLQALRKELKKQIKKFRQLSTKRPTLFSPLLVFTLLFLVLSSYHLAYWQKIYPGVKVAGQPVGNRTVDEAIREIELRTKDHESRTIILAYNNQIWELDLGQFNFAYQAKETAQRAYQVGRSDHPIHDLKTKVNAWFKGVNLDLAYQLDQPLLETQIATIAAELFVPAIEPTIKVFETVPPGASSRIAIEAGKQGQKLDEQKLISTINSQLATISLSPILLPIITLSPTLANEQIEKTRTRAENFLDESLVLSSEENRWELGEEEIINFLSFTDQFDEEKIASYTATLAKNIDRPPQNATFQFLPAGRQGEGGRVTQFQPAKDGLAIERERTRELITTALAEMEKEEEEEEKRIQLPIVTTPPEVMVEEINDLGIKELLGRGVSYFRGSIASRIHNIQLASSRLNGLLIPPGETFSFNQALGEVSRETGFKEAYIIKEGRTILGDGGGVCQVSTTFFRAALNSGLPIIERQAHAYRVAYYEQGFPPGLDATVWEPFPDLKIRNDTPAHVLIQAYANTGAGSLTFDFYGTSDGRVATIGKSRIWDQVPPPPDLYQDDPTLPAGTVKQIDWKAWGAKVAFDWKVVRNSETLQERTFYSNYRPWQAVFLQGTGPPQ